MSFTLRRSVSFLLVFLFLVSLFPAAVCGEEEVEEVPLDGDFLSEDTTADFTPEDQMPYLIKVRAEDADRKSSEKIFVLFVE